MLNIPKVLVPEADKFVGKLSSALGEDLVAVVAYGRWLRANRVSDTVELNLMIVLKEIRTDLLDKIADARAQSEPWALLTLSLDDLASSTDVFPIKLINMQRGHLLLHGKDVLSGLEIDRADLRFRCEQEIKNLMLRLRLHYLNRSHDARGIRMILENAHFTLMSSLAVLVELKTGHVPESGEEILQAIEAVDVPTDSLRQIARLGEDRNKTMSDLKGLFIGLMTTVHEAASVADQA